MVWFALVTGALSLLVGLLGNSAPAQAAVTGNVIPDPTVNTSSSGFNGTVVTSVVQTDGRIVIGGSFTAFNGIARNRIARLNSDGTLDPRYDPGAGFNGLSTRSRCCRAANSPQGGSSPHSTVPRCSG